MMLKKLVGCMAGPRRILSAECCNRHVRVLQELMHVLLMSAGL